ncbi:MAG: AAA family ATPase [Euryarchaeota archaeon]|nr:AAA family ATPase [Euryarchaeota archaeon]
MSKNLDLLVSLNAWWRREAFKTGIIREKYSEKIRKYLDTGEILVLNGVRRSGKTIILFRIIDELMRNRNIEARRILFINCDEPALAGFANPLETLIDTYRK